MHYYQDAAQKKSDGDQTNDSSQEVSAKGTDGKDETKGTSGEENTYNIITNIWGSGSFPLDAIVATEQYVADHYDANLDIANNDFTADKVISQLQNQLANDPDGSIYFGIASTLFPSVVKEFQNKGIPYVFTTNIPADFVLETCYEDELFCGAVYADPYNIGATMAEQALADGNQTAIIIAAAIGDFSHDKRIEGFTDTFEAEGGQVLQVQHCADPSEAVTKSNDLITAQPDAECIYATGGDFLSACVSCLESRKDIQMMVYGTDIDPSVIEYVENGTVTAINGGQWVDGGLSETLLINYLDGHQIVDSDGKAPVFHNLSVFVVTGQNAAKFKEMLNNDINMLKTDTYDKLLYRTNPDVTIDTYNEVLEGYAQAVYEMLEQ